MKTASGALAAVLLLAGIGSMPSALAQGVPRGSYTRSCNNVAVQGDTLVANCRRADGREDRSALAGFHRCVGDIGNNNGALQCSVAGGGALRGQVMAEPGRGPGPGPGPGPGYGAQPGYGATPSYGAPPPGWERARWERCHELHERAEDARMRLEREYNPVERGRLEGRLQEMRERLERCR
jgi:hypothetical protein